MKQHDLPTIVIDARTIESSTGRYTQYVLHHLNKSYTDEFSFVVLVPPAVVSKWQSQLPHITVKPAGERPYSVGEQTSLIKKLESARPDLVHFTMPQQPFLWLGPSVTGVYDLTLVRYDNIDMNRLVYKMKKGVFISLLRTVIMRSRAIITLTEFGKQDITNYMGGRFSKKIHVTLCAGEIIDATPKPITKLRDKKFLFFIGNAFPYKNIQLIIDAFASIQQQNPDLHLALAGKKDYFYQKLEAYVSKHNIKNVHFLGFITDGEKRWAYQNCFSYVTASVSEGFNMPLIEAMGEGAPVLASQATCHPEVAADAALYFDPTSVDSLAETMTQILGDDKLRQDLIKKGRVQARQFSWQDVAARTVEAYRQALSK